MRAALNLNKSAMMLSNRLIPALFCVAACFFGNLGTSWADERCGAPQFGIQNVSIDQRAETASEARNLGIRTAAETGFRVVVTRLLNDQQTVASFIADHDLDAFTDFVHIDSENSLEGRYIGLLDFCFDADRLRAAFKEANLSWAELASEPILVLPVWQAPDGARAWQQDNEWLAGWRDAVNEATGLLRFLLLEPTIANERRLRASALATADSATLKRAAAMAGASQTMLVMARLDYAGSAPILNVTGQLFSADGVQLTELANMADIAVEGDLSPHLEAARSVILRQMESSWHAANILSGAEGQDLTLNIPVRSLQEWSSRLSVLANLPVIDDYKIRKLDIESGVVTIWLAGSMETLRNALAAHDLRIDQADDGRMILAQQ